MGDRHAQHGADVLPHQRPLSLDIEMVTWVTPLLKAFNRPDAHLAKVTTAPPFAGLRISGIYTSPRAVGIDGVGTLAFD